MKLLDIYETQHLEISNLLLSGFSEENIHSVNHAVKALLSLPEKLQKVSYNGLVLNSIRITHQNSGSLQKLKSVAFTDCRIKDLALHSDIAHKFLFHNCQIGNVKIRGSQEVIFNNGTQIGDISATENRENTYFSEAVVEKAVFGNGFFKSIFAFDTTFNEVLFKGSQVLESIYFNRCTFLGAPIVEVEKLPVDTSFQGSRFPFEGLYAEARYRHLASLLKKIDNDADYYLLAGSELAARHDRLRNDTNSRAVFLLSLCYKILNDFGRSATRPFKLLFYFLSLNFLLHRLFFLFSSDAFILAKDAPTFAQSWGVQQISLWTALTSILGPFRLYGPLAAFTPGEWYVVLWVTLETIISTLLWYLGITGIRRQFRT